VRDLMQKNPGWGAADAGGLLREMAATKRPLGLYIARLLRHEKQADLARRVLEAQLAATPAVDAVYAEYLAVAGPDARPLLAKLLAVDRYEERPLIWRARLELDAGDHAAAAATLQEAINIDPSDGEQGPGDRMRVYAFMSEAMVAKGDAEKAKFLADVVKAIRLSETADRWFALGAYDQAITLYRQALGVFQDAYCIQSRLAVRLAKEGRIDEAAEHYRRAFELMPDSFGRVESHCFGCEHVFAGKESQGVAEEVFTRMLAARPDKPQLHYLMGYLRQEQERDAEAGEHYRRAVALDPLYLNAWSRLQGLEPKLKLTPAERDDLLLKLVELDPAGRHASPNLSSVGDIPRMWRALTAARQLVATLPSAEKLWPLKASAARLAATPDRDFQFWLADRRREPADVLLENRFVEAVRNYLASLTPPPADN
jgi:tetratricopeptide (TPR) repeat protein